MDTKRLELKRDRRDRTRRLDAPGDNWPVLDFELIREAMENSLLVAMMLRDEPEWEELDG
jgi:hypothetical protein